MAYRDDREALHAQVEALESELREERARLGKLEQELEHERQEHEHQEQPLEEQRHPKQKPSAETPSPPQPRRKAKRRGKREAAAESLLGDVVSGTIAASCVAGTLAVILGTLAVTELKQGGLARVVDTAGAAGYAITLLLILLKPWSWASGGIAACAVGLGMAGADLLLYSGWRAFLGFAAAIVVTSLLSWDDDRRSE